MHGDFPYRLPVLKPKCEQHTYTIIYSKIYPSIYKIVCHFFLLIKLLRTSTVEQKTKGLALI